MEIQKLIMYQCGDDQITTFIELEPTMQELQSTIDVCRESPEMKDWALGINGIVMIQSKNFAGSIDDAISQSVYFCSDCGGWGFHEEPGWDGGLERVFYYHVRCTTCNGTGKGKS